MELATGYWASMVLLSLNELGIFTILSGDGLSATEVADKGGLDARAVRFLLDSGANLGLLRRQDDRYTNAPDAETFLVEGKPFYMGGGIKYALDTFPMWGKLPAAVQTGEPQLAAEQYLGEDKARTRRFVYAMHHRAKPTAFGLGQGIDLSGCKRLLDLGGGSGAYSIMFCKRHPELRATLFDLPGVLEVASEIVAAEGVTDQVELKPGSYHTDDLGEAIYDAVFLNGMLHRESEAFTQELLGRVKRALVPGGRVFITDVMIDDSGHGPLFSTLFALNMLLSAPGGGAHSTADQRQWLEAQGFTDVQVWPLPQPATHTLISARLV
jgi:ubiquinone/menaquinone biosynthesis C-methylase UbiE